MITNTTKTEIISNITNNQQFAIKASASAFEILSSTLYSDKILAVVRELCANAYDSHTAVGKQNIPFEVNLPSSYHPIFYVKDFGTGLSHDQVVTLYTTYFDSTKQDSNDFIGALGLGSKSPFSYTSSFTVESTFNNETRLYTCFKNELGLPTITLMNTQYTTNPNGLTISIAVDLDDIDKFIQAAKKALTYYSPTPTILGVPDFTTLPISYCLEHNNWKIRHHQAYRNIHGAQIIQGFIAYPIDFSAIKDHGLTDLAKLMAYVNIDFFVDIGDVDIAASREALSYTPTTIAKLVTLFNKTVSELHTSIQSMFDQAPNKWEAGKIFDLFRGSVDYELYQLVSSLNKSKNFTWNNKPATNQITIDTSDIKHTKITHYSLHLTYNGKTTVNCIVNCRPLIQTTFDIRVTSRVLVVIDKNSSGNTSAYSNYLQKHNSSNQGPYTLLVLRPTKKSTFSETEIHTILNRLDITQYEYIEPTPKPIKITPPPTNNTPPTHKTCWISGKLTRSTFDPNSGGIYLHVSEATSSFKQDAITQIINTAIDFNIIPKSVNIFLLSKSESKYLPNTWQHLSNYLSDMIILNNSEIQRKLRRRIVEKYLYTITPVLNNFNEIQANLNDGLFKDIISEFADYMTAPMLPYRYTLISFINQYNNNPLIQKIIDDSEQFEITTQTKLNNLYAKYPMLTAITINTQPANIIVDYINLIDTK